MSDPLLADLRRAYDAKVTEREQQPAEPFKIAERHAFLRLLQLAGARTLLELGPGPGMHGAFFASNGLRVTAMDLSAAMAGACAARGLTALVGDAGRPPLRAGSVDAVFALNCLLHVPRARMPGVLDALAELLPPGGLLYVGQYAGEDTEGSVEADPYEPKRFFSFLRETTLRALLEPRFEILELYELPSTRERRFLSSVSRVR